MISTRGLIVSTAVLMAGQAAAGADEGIRFKIDPVHSSVVFKVKHNDLTYVYGRFNRVQGTIEVDDRKQPTSFTFDVEVMARTLDTNNGKRDKHIEGPEFLDTREHPRITFTGKTVKALEEPNQYELTGTLMLLGKEQEMTVVMEFIGSKQVGSEDRIGIHSTFTVKRGEFGMNRMTNSIGNDVEVMVGLEAAVKSERPPAG